MFQKTATLDRCSARSVPTHVPGSRHVRAGRHRVRASAGPGALRGCSDTCRKRSAVRTPRPRSTIGLHDRGAARRPFADEVDQPDRCGGCRTLRHGQCSGTSRNTAVERRVCHRAGARRLRIRRTSRSVRRLPSQPRSARGDPPGSHRRAARLPARSLSRSARLLPVAPAEQTARLPSPRDGGGSLAVTMRRRTVRSPLPPRPAVPDAGNGPRPRRARGRGSRRSRRGGRSRHRERAGRACPSGCRCAR